MLVLEDWVCFCVEAIEKSKNGFLLMVESLIVK